MKSPLKEVVPFVFSQRDTKELVETLHANLKKKPHAKALTKGQLKSLAQEVFVERLVEKLKN